LLFGQIWCVIALENLGEVDHLENPNPNPKVDGKIILKWTFKK
jgi:hypothetical protein